jgi:fructose-bisphosphate aldolase class I
MNVEQLKKVARDMVAPGKGILAADESTGTIKKRLDSVGVESTEETRRAYREILLTAAGMEEFISGVILYDETLRQSASDGTPFARHLADKGVIPGIKVDAGAKELAGHPGEKVTEGLDGLRERLAEYHELGARFAKWRAVITIDETAGLPSDFCLEANAHALARYAALCQEAGIVPIVEPEVLMDGSNGIETCEAVTARTLNRVFNALFAHGVVLEGIILKPNMVIAGKKAKQQASAREVAEATLRCLRRHVPAAVPGICFLSGGQSDVAATEHLNIMNEIGGNPWELSFSYGRALQAAALQTWGGDPAKAEAAQKAFHHRARCNGAARSGRWSDSMEQHRAA